MFNIKESLSDFATVAHLDKLAYKAFEVAISDFVTVQDELNKLNIVTNFSYRCFEQDGFVWFIKWHRLNSNGCIGKLRIMVNDEHFQIPINGPTTKKPRARKFYNLSDEDTIIMHKYLPQFLTSFKQYLIAEKG